MVANSIYADSDQQPNYIRLSRVPFRSSPRVVRRRKTESKRGKEREPQDVNGQIAFEREEYRNKYLLTRSKTGPGIKPLHY